MDPMRMHMLYARTCRRVRTRVYIHSLVCLYVFFATAALPVRSRSLSFPTWVYLHLPPLAYGNAIGRRAYSLANLAVLVPVLVLVLVLVPVPVPVLVRWLPPSLSTHGVRYVAPPLGGVRQSTYSPSTLCWVPTLLSKPGRLTVSPGTGSGSSSGSGARQGTGIYARHAHGTAVRVSCACVFRLRASFQGRPGSGPGARPWRASVRGKMEA
ncbi:hypothetical protein BD413DRAFT_137108 [Trametes elegans]|nr:hypothetical protein BD413DRAFT_137108 [Trametes elegans]